MDHVLRRALLLALVVVGIAASPARAQAPSPTATALPQPPPEVYLKPGDVVLPFEAQGVDGVPRRIDFPKKQTTILVFFSSGCPHCHRMLPEWNRMFATLPKNLALVGVIIDKEPPTFFEHFAIQFPVLRSPGRNLLTDFKVARVPLTLRIAPGGKVEDVEVGELDPIKLGSVFRP
jgi:hypothetical protein